MKKIFAIALALVMVLSMASAFALNDCFSGFDWTCSTNTNCGKGKIEVVPYVKVNACDGVDWQVSTCATAINTENVYFAIKLTVDANTDPAWFNNANIKVTGKGVKMPADLAPWATAGAYWAGVETDKDEEVVYYLRKDAKTWTDEEDDNFKTADYVFTAKVTDAKKAKVCATLASENKGIGSWTYGDYTVTVAANKLTIKNDYGNEFVMSWKDDKVNSITATNAAFMAEVQAKFNLSGCVIGTCVDEDIIQRNFGWDDEFESCFGWSDKGAAVVDAECVVAIPKTGDASVLAWLF